MFLDYIFVNNAKIALEHFLNYPNQAKIEYRRNAEILVNSVKVAFSGIQNGKTQPILRIVTWNFAHIFIKKCSWLQCHPFRFWKIKNENFKKKIVWWLFFPIFKTSKISKISKRKLFGNYFSQFSKHQKFQSLRLQFTSHVQSPYFFSNTNLVLF